MQLFQLFLPGALETKIPVYKLFSLDSRALFEDMHISSTFLKHHLAVFRGHRKPVLFVGFFSGWAVFALQLVYLWQIATCSWQQTFTLSSGGVATLCFAHLCWGTRKNLPVCIHCWGVKTSFTAALLVLCRGPSSQVVGNVGGQCVRVPVCARARLVLPCMDLSIKQLAIGCTSPTLQSQITLCWCGPKLSFNPPCLPCSLRLPIMLNR